MVLNCLVLSITCFYNIRFDYLQHYSSTVESSLLNENVLVCLLFSQISIYCSDVGNYLRKPIQIYKLCMALRWYIPF
jgi:hypothetical protein